VTDWLLYLTLASLLVTGLGLNLVGLPGLWLMVGAHGMYAWLDQEDGLAGWQSCLAMLALALLAEAIEFLAGAAGSKRAGGSLRSTAGAVLGGVVGGIGAVVLVPWLPILNAVLGACVGSFIGAALLESSKYVGDEESRPEYYTRLRTVGWGAFKGKFWGVLLKSAVGVVMLVVSLWTAFS
jgi:uncharacterized protein YqgC (DUF456 family)